MPGLYDELVRVAPGLELAATAAMESLGLVPHEFKLFSGETRQPVEAQQALDPSEGPVSHFEGMAVCYGGGNKKIAQSLGYHAFGHIEALIGERVLGNTEAPADEERQAQQLGSKNGIIVVDTFAHYITSESFLVVDDRRPGMFSKPHSRQTMSYNIETKYVLVKSGVLATPSFGQSGSRYGETQDLTVEQNALELPDEVLLPRLATLVRTIKATSFILNQVAQQNNDIVKWGSLSGPSEGF